MTSRAFVYWLQGSAELSDTAPTDLQWETIKRHLNLVFKHEIDPSMGDDKHREELEEIHAPSPSGLRQSPSGGHRLMC